MKLLALHSYGNIELLALHSYGSIEHIDLFAFPGKSFSFILVAMSSCDYKIEVFC